MESALTGFEVCFYYAGKECNLIRKTFHLKQIFQMSKFKFVIKIFK